MNLNKHVAVLGAAGRVGQSLSLLLKVNPNVDKISLYATDSLIHGIAADLSHIDTEATVESYSGNDTQTIQDAVSGADLILILSVGRKNGMTREDLFNTNADIVAKLSASCAKAAPNAIVGIITNPANSIVPLAVSIFERLNVDPSKIYGVTTLDLIRANGFISEIGNTNPLDVHVPVVGGHEGITIIPVLSQVQPAGCIVELDEQAIKELVSKIQTAGLDVLEAKEGRGSAKLSLAYSAARFANSAIRALHGEEVIESAYVRTDDLDDIPVDYFSTPLMIGPDGKIKENFGIGDIDDYEKELVAVAAKQLEHEIAKGRQFAEKFTGL